MYYCSYEDDDEPDVSNIIGGGDEDKEERCGYNCYFSSAGTCWKLASDGADGDFEVSEEEMELVSFKI